MKHLLVFSAAFVLVLSLVALSPPARAGTVTGCSGGQCVYFFSPCGAGGGCFNITFASDLTFSNQIQWTSADTLVIDGTTLQVDKRPDAYPALLLNFTTYNPGGNAAVIFDAIGTLAAGTDIWVNVSGLNSALLYQWSVNGQVFQVQSGPSPALHWWVFPFTSDVKLNVFPGPAIAAPFWYGASPTMGVIVLVLMIVAVPLVLLVRRMTRARRRRRSRGG